MRCLNNPCKDIKPVHPEILCEEGLTFKKLGMTFVFIQVGDNIYKIFEITSYNRWSDKQFKRNENVADYINGMGDF